MPRRRAALLALLIALGACAAAHASEIVVLVQPPIWPRGEAPARPPGLAAFTALLASALDAPVRVRVSDDVLSHWQAVRAAPDHQIAFDEAHFADFRIRRHGFTAIARDAADVRFAVLVRPGTLVTGPSDLAARVVAAPPPPSLAAVRLMALFPDAARAPRLRVVDSLAQALDLLARGEVAGALAPLEDTAPAPRARAALITDVSPGRGVTVGPTVAGAARGALARALVAAADSASGRRALAAVGVRAMAPASNEVFEDSARLLRGTWGYR